MLQVIKREQKQALYVVTGKGCVTTGDDEKSEEDVPLLFLWFWDCVLGKCSTTEPPLCFLNFKTGCHEVVYVGLEFIL